MNLFLSRITSVAALVTLLTGCGASEPVGEEPGLQSGEVYDRGGDKGKLGLETNNPAQDSTPTIQ